MQRKIIILNLIVLLAIVSFASSLMVEAKEIHVLKDFPTIQAAIDAAASGDTVMVASGTYEENIEMKDGVSLVGAGAGTTTITAKGGAIMKANNFSSPTKIEGFTLDGRKLAQRGIEGENSNLVIKYNIIKDNKDDGIYTNDFPTTCSYIRGNKIVDNGGDGVEARFACNMGAKEDPGMNEIYNNNGYAVRTGNWGADAILNWWGQEPPDEAKFGFVRYKPWLSKPPVPSVSINDGADFTLSTSVTLTLSPQKTASFWPATDAQMQFSNGNRTWTNFEPFATSKKWILPGGDGTKSVYAGFKDVAGNLIPTVSSDSIILDATPPTGILSINGGDASTTSPIVGLTLSAYDATIGMGKGAQMQFSNDNRIWSEPEPFATYKAWTLSDGAGIKTVYAKFKDAAGNWMTSSVSDDILLTSPPLPNPEKRLADTPWPMFGHDPQHTGRSPYVGPDTPKLAWQFSTEGEFGPPIIGMDGEDSIIYVISKGQKPGRILHAFHSNGSVKWTYKFKDFRAYSVSAPAISADGTVYVVAMDAFNLNYLFAITPEGKRRWKCQLPGTEGGPQSGSPAIAPDGTIYVFSTLGGSPNNILHAINPDGKLKWQYEMEYEGGWSPTSCSDSSPAIGFDGTIYVLSRNGALYAINPDGTYRWKRQLEHGSLSSGAQIYSPAIGPDGTIYIGRHRKTFAINLDGSEKWRSDTFGIDNIPAIGKDGTVYTAPSQSDYAAPVALMALDPTTGDEKWSCSGDDNRSETGIPAIDDEGTIYSGNGKYLYAINPDGTLKWRYETPKRVNWAPAIDSNGAIYFVAKNSVYCLSPAADGEIPDLLVSRISFDPPATSVGGEVNIQAVIQNANPKASGYCDVSFYYDSKEKLIGKTRIYFVAGRPAHAKLTWHTQNKPAKEYKIIAVISNSFPPDPNPDNNEGEDMYMVYPTVQSRIDAAQPGETVLVEPGEYFENITMKDGVSVKSIGGPEVTIIDGRQKDTVVVFDYIKDTEGTVLEGFTITNGKGPMPVGIDIIRGGGTIRNNLIIENSEGIRMIGSFALPEPPVIENNVITQNDGGGIDANNPINANGIALVINNTIVNNGEGKGHGIKSLGFYQPTPIIKNCIIWGNGDDLAGTAEATYSCIEDEDSGEGNISEDPRFVDAVNEPNDYHLQPDSPCMGW